MSHIGLHRTKGQGNGNISSDNDGYYATRTLTINGEEKLIHHLHKCCTWVRELVGYEIYINGKTYPHHQKTYAHLHYLLIYAAGYRIETGSYEHILNKLHSKNAKDNMIRDETNTAEHSNGDHSFHRLVMISNSVYFCIPIDHT